MQSFDCMGAVFNPPDFSDNCSGLIFCKEPVRQKSGSFKIFNYLTRHKDFNKIVQNAWSSHVKGTSMFQLCKQLKALKKEFRNLNGRSYSNIHYRVEQARSHLLQFQRDKLTRFFNHSGSRRGGPSLNACRTWNLYWLKSPI